MKVMNGSEGDGFVRVDTFSGGYYLLGGSGSTDYDLTGVGGTIPGYWIIKTDTNRNVIWQKRYGSSENEDKDGLVTTSDGGCMVVGVTTGCDSNVLCNTTCSQVIWLIKLDKDGNLLWQRCLGGSQWERVFDIDATSDGGALITGRTGSGDGDFNIHYGSVFVDDGFVLKVDSNGYVQWSRIIGGSSYDYPSAGHEISGNKYVVLLNTSSTDHDMAGLGASNYSCLVMVLDTSGSILQKKCFSGNGEVSLEDFIQLPTGEILFAGETDSDTGLYIGNQGWGDMLVIKTDEQLNLIWIKLIGTIGYESADNVQTDQQGNLYLSGNIYADTGIFTHPHNTSSPVKSEIACVKTDSAGNFIWSKTLGGEQEDFVHDLLYVNGEVQLVGNVRGPVDFFDTLPYND